MTGTAPASVHCFAGSVTVIVGGVEGSATRTLGPVVGPDPTLTLSGDFPVTVGSDGSFSYPQPDGADRVRVMSVAPPGSPVVVASLPPATEVGPDGKAKSAPWIHGLAAGPDGSLYYAEMAAVRRIARRHGLARGRRHQCPRLRPASGGTRRAAGARAAGPRRDV